MDKRLKRLQYIENVDKESKAKAMAEKRQKKKEVVKKKTTE